MPTSLTHHPSTQENLNGYSGNEPTANINIYFLPNVDLRQHDWVILWTQSEKMFPENSKSQGCGVSRCRIHSSHAHTVSGPVSTENIVGGKKYPALIQQIPVNIRGLGRWLSV